MNPPSPSCPIPRRRFASLALGAAATSLAAPRLALGNAAPAATIHDLRVVSPQSEYYHGWPTLGILGNGDLIAVWSGRRREHVCPFGTVEMMLSRDSGDTWTYPRTVHESAIDDRDAGVLETAKGTIFVTSFSSLAYVRSMEPGGKFAEDPRWIAAHHRLPDDAAREAELGCWGFRSVDGGLTFSERIDTVVNSPHGPCQLKDGRLLYLGKELWTEEKRIGAAESLDDGETWSWISEVPTREGDAGRDYHELHAVECPSGKILAQIRNHNETDHRETLQTESLDGGRTWSEPAAIGVWGLPTHLLVLSDGRLLMTYGYRRTPFGNQARVSEDEGATWSEPIPLSEDGVGSDLGYPSTVELADGTLATLWYEKFADSPRAQLRLARWALEA